MLHDLYVIDKPTRDIHKIGVDTHDSLTVMHGAIHYQNLQNGDGGTCYSDDADDGYGYCILETDCGMLEDEFGIIDKRYEKEIEEFLRSK